MGPTCAQLGPQDRVAVLISNVEQPSITSLEDSVQTLKQYLDEQFVAFGRDLTVKIDTASRMASRESTSTSADAIGAPPNNNGGQGRSQDFQGKLPVPPSYEGVCGGFPTGKSKGGVSRH